MRARQDVAHLRAQRVFGVVRESIRRGQRETFRVVHYSVQHDHVHLVVEASDRECLRSGVQGLATRIARAVNRALGRRRGRVWADRYHRRDLRTPREVRNALVYVLMNHRKHVLGAARRDAPEGLAARVSLDDALRVAELDPCSSAEWLDGWTARAGPLVARLQGASSPHLVSTANTSRDQRFDPRNAIEKVHASLRDAPAAAAPVVAPRSWLARVGWRLHGLLDGRECPRAL